MLYLCGTKSDLISSGERARDVSYDEAVEYGRGKTVICFYIVPLVLILLIIIIIFVIIIIIAIVIILIHPRIEQ